MGTDLPPLSPALLARPFLRGVPLPVAQLVAQSLLRMVAGRHRTLFDRLKPLGTRTFRVEPVDLPFAFLLEPGRSPPRVRVLPDGAPDAADVTVRGALADLVGLLEGRIDGDALFFSRALRFEGDTEALLVLRNAVDGGGVDLLAEIAGSLGPLSGWVRRRARQGVRLAGTMMQDIDRLRWAVVEPLALEVVRLERRMGEIEDGMRTATRPSPRRGSGAR